MSSENQSHSNFPGLPPSLSAGGHEMHDYYVSQGHPRPAPNTAPNLTPYLGLRARLSQTWLNRWTILLVLVLARVLLAVNNVNADLASARSEALSACSDVESMGSTMASMPYYLAQGVNELAATGVEQAVSGLSDMLMLTVTGVEELLLFVIDLVIGTYACLITLVITGSLEAAVELLEDATNYLNKTLGGIESDLISGWNKVQDEVNDALKAISGIPELFGSSGTITVNLTSDVDQLSNVTLPADLIDAKLQQLNNSLPDFSQVKSAVSGLISEPFDDVKNLINSSFSGYKFDRSVFPVPQKEQLTFCSDNNGINDFFNELGKIAQTAKIVFIVVLVILAIAACIPMAYREIWSWRTTRKRAQLVTTNSFDPIDVVQIASRPYSSTIGIKAASRFQSPRRQILVRWFVAYCTTTPALFVLSLGIAGLLSALLQYILLKTIEKEAPQLANEVGDFASQVVSALTNASAAWANGTNSVINSTNSDINNQLFGWVNTTTTALNTTLNDGMDQVNDFVNSTFGGTVLYDPVQGVLQCLIGLKVAGIEKALTWVSDNAQVNFPMLPNNTFSLGAEASITNSSNPSDSFLASPDSVTSDEITSAVVSMTNALASGIKNEAIIAAVLVGVWLFVVLIGLIRTVSMFYRRDKVRGEGGPTYYDTADAGIDGAPSDPAPAYRRSVVPRVSVFSPISPESDSITRISPDEGLSPWTKNEKVGYVEARNGAVINDPSVDARQSSYGQVGTHEKC